MRSIKIAVLALALFAMNAVFAQNDKVKEDAKQSVFEMAKERAEANARALNNTVELTDEQKKQIKDITRTKLKELKTREEAKPNAAKGKGQARQMQVELNKEIMAVLTPEQAAQVKEAGIFRGGNAKGHEGHGHDDHGDHADHDHAGHDHADHADHDHGGKGKGKDRANMTEEERIKARSDRAKKIAMDQSKELDEVVDLSDDQKNEIVRLNKSLFDKGREFRRENPDATGEEKRIFAKALMKERLEAYREILNEEQIDKFIAHKRAMEAGE